jgi:DNA-binding transcriptional regulator YdaS (Cro superfamily)
MRISEYLKIKNAYEFADEIGVSAASVSYYRSGRMMPSPVIAKRIIEATGGQVSYEDLYGKPEEA